MAQLVNADAEFRIDMAYGNVGISSSHNVRIEAHTNRHGAAVFVAKLLQNHQVVDIDAHAFSHRHINFFHAHTVGRVQNALRRKACAQPQPHFLYGHGI